MSLDFVDMFCGAGGSSIGLTGAGMTLRWAGNHWRRAIETHERNFPHAEHACEDLNAFDMRNLPRAQVLWASPICTEVSPAGGRPTWKNPRPKGTLFDELEEGGHVEQEGFERTRATFHDVIRATELHRFDAVLVENVPYVAWRWELFDWWVSGMQLLGYNVQFVSASSAHLSSPGNPPAPQWRDRLYMVFTRTGIPLPDVQPRPLARCQPCGVDVHAVQTWKKTPKTRLRKVGMYGRQYVYACPNSRCGTPVEPYVLPAASAIDWSDLGERVGDKTLRPNTIRRIRAGLEMFADRQSLITLTHGQHGDARALPLDSAPFPTRTIKIGEGVLTPPFLVPAGGTWNDTASAVDVPFRTRTAREAEALLVPDAFIAVLRNHATAHSVDEPFRTIAAGGNHHALVVPYRRGNRPSTTDRPMHTLHTKDSGALVQPAVDVDDCLFRMLKPRENLRTQRFPDSYHVVGNIGEQTMQAGNAVSTNAAQFLGEAVARVLAGAR